MGTDAILTEDDPDETLDIPSAQLNPPLWEQIRAWSLLFGAIWAVGYILKLITLLLGEMRHAATSGVGRATAFAIVLLLAIIATWLRARHRIIYGVVETAFGGFTVWHSLGSLEGDYAVVTVALLVGSFAVTRGFSSIHEGRKAHADARATERGRELTRMDTL